jgi:hypothetical protein
MREKTNSISGGFENRGGATSAIQIIGGVSNRSVLTLGGVVSNRGGSTTGPLNF